MNTVTLIGRLDADPVSRLVGKRPVVRIRIAVENRGDPHHTIVDVDVWGNQGAAVATYLSQGRLVGIIGRLCSSVWRDGVTNRRQHVFVTAYAVDFLDRPGANGSTSGSRAAMQV